jgi:hypothetical protein
MRRIGFSTGALALGNFMQGLELQRRPDVTAVELSALREEELDVLIDALPTLDLGHFAHVSFHAPSRVSSERRVVDRLKVVQDQAIPIVVHPDVISDFGVWRELGDSVLLENMDQRKPVCRTAPEMKRFFKELPEAQFCFDIAHARQVDPTMTVADEFLHAFSDRLAEVHISEVDEQCRHVAITHSAIRSYRSVAHQISDTIPVIIESMIGHDRLGEELIRSHASLVPLSIDTSVVRSA